MKNNKDLVLSVETKIYQRENVVDKIKFYVPNNYDGLDLSPFTATLYYTDPTDMAQMEILEKQESDKDNFLLFTLPVNTKITVFAGEVTMHLSLTYMEVATNTQYVLKTGEISFTVCKWKDYYKYVSNESLAPLDNKMLEIDNKIQQLASIAMVYAEDLIDDLDLTGDQLTLVNKQGEKTKGVTLPLPPRDLDSTDDGVNDLNNISEDMPNDATSIISL